MALDALLASLEGRAITSVTPFANTEVTPKPAPAKACTAVPYVTPQNDSADLLAQFRFDLAQVDIDAGYPADELHRVNNIAWRLIAERHYTFKEAQIAAAKWVVDNPPHPDEVHFIDVMTLFKRLDK